MLGTQVRPVKHGIKDHHENGPLNLQDVQVAQELQELKNHQGELGKARAGYSMLKQWKLLQQEPLR